MSSKLNNMALRVDAPFADFRKMPGSWVVDQRGTFGVLADYDSEGSQAWFISLDGDVPFTVSHSRHAVRALHLSVEGVEVISGALRPCKIDDQCPLGALVFDEQGACIVIQEQQEGRELERRLFNLVSKKILDVNGQVRLMGRYWTLRGLRDGKVVLEYDVEALDEVPLEPVPRAQFKNPT